MEKHAAVDLHGKDLRVGDWVRVLAVPLSIRDMPEESKDAFSRAVGHTFQIESFDETGCLQLQMWPKVSFDTIWLEPFCVERYRRYKRLSKAFQRTLERDAAPSPPRYEIEFDIKLKDGVDIEEFGHHLVQFGTGGGFATWPRQRRIKGSVYVDKSESDAIARLEEVRRHVAESEQVESSYLGEIGEAKDA